MAKNDPMDALNQIKKAEEKAHKMIVETREKKSLEIIQNAQKEAEKINASFLEKARKKAEKTRQGIVQEAKEEARRIKQDMEEEAQRIREKALPLIPEAVEKTAAKIEQYLKDKGF